MKKMIQFLITTGLTVGLLLFFYFFYPHVWGEVLYPLEYQESISKYGTQFGVNQNLICAFIYTESRFNAKSTSGVGARGLMQVMPSTGRAIAEELGESGYSADKLYDPDTNIRYGTWYIKGLYDQYHGDIAMVAAGYNAGRGRADDWHDRGRALPTETVYFIDKIKNTKEMYDKVYGQWWLVSSSPKPTSFYRGIVNFQDYVNGLITGAK